MSIDIEAAGRYKRANAKLANAETPLIRECWYVAVTADELTRELRSRTILDRSIVLYRKEDGGAVALQNRCAHRSYPLSESTLEGDNIICGYHGISWAPDGRCVDIPCQTNCPDTVRIKSYPVVEKGPIVWIWMGAPENAKEEDIPELPWLDDSRWATVNGEFHLKCNYLFMQENLMDLSHFPFLHGSTLGASGFASLPVTMLDTDDGTIQYCREIEDNPVLLQTLPLLYQEQLKGKKTLNRNSGCFVSPALSTGSDNIIAFDPDSGNEVSALHGNLAHFLTPETQKTTHYFWFVGHDFAISDSKEDKEYWDLTYKLTKAVFTQDERAAELVQSMVDTDSDPEYVERYIAGDKMGLAMRRLVLELANQE